MKNRVLLTAVSSVMALGMLTACGADNNRMNNDGDVNYRPVRYNPDNNMDGNRENNNGVFDNDDNRNSNQTGRDRRVNVLNRNRDMVPMEYEDNEIDVNSIRGMTERSDGRGRTDRNNRSMTRDAGDNYSGNRNERGMMNNGYNNVNHNDRGLIKNDNMNVNEDRADNDRNGLGGRNGNLTGNR